MRVIMTDLESPTKLNKKILLCLLISFMLFLTSCSNNKNNILKQNIAESSTETQKEEITDTRKEIKVISSDRSKIIKLVEKEKIFNINVDSKFTKEDFSLFINLENEEMIINNLNSIKIGLSVQDFKKELSTQIGKFDNSKKYWEIKLNNGKLKEKYNIDISKNTNLLTDKEIELLLNKKESLVLRFDIFIDEQSPVRIYNHFLN
ncbi:hypothetical protein [Helcococcus kunzii]|uniref:hypothetical protein n=1 Tax=Helcococcus kunzii TaxID=40091 RepID=UPI0024AD598B|nr:hypothetical protein [Helcococcus kunzii]